jgi:(1->4)-alpha-D-glucan 1-alpha-D-glucosylmutase
VPAARRRPASTYRVQLHRAFTFADAAAAVPYLWKLGVDWLYCSPYLKARPESTHGYDVSDHGELNPVLGDYAVLEAALRERGMGQLLDVVPNHMGIGEPDNRWWWDVLENGQRSRYAAHFDIDWAAHDHRVLLPILGDQYGAVLESGQIRVVVEDGTARLRVYDRHLPLAPETRADASEALNGDLDRLDELLGRQHYRLAYWRVASEEINYRRFFDVNDLAAIRMEVPGVFEETHRLVLELMRRGSVTGLRLDHPDGLWDPAAYTARLREATGGAYVVAEKILASDEELPADWAVDGTVGYELLNQLTWLLVDARRERRIDRIYREFAEVDPDYAELVHASKRLIQQVALASELNVLARLARRISARSRRYRDFTFFELRRAVRELIAAFPVYRTYVREDDRRISRRDRAYVERAAAGARRRNPAMDRSYFDFLRELLLLRVEDPEARTFVMKLQQVSGPVAAKGVEDTAFYVFNRLVALNEVGGEPDRFGVTVAQFHRFCAQRPAGGLSTTSTHDTKRSEDVRARIAVLVELPNEWERALTAWSRIARKHRRRVAGRPAPDRGEEYLLYQTLLGAWPISADRAVEYMRKATKEAKVNTSWISPNERWDAAVEQFVRALLADEAFLGAFRPLQERVAGYGMYNGLSQLLLKLAVPGVPDVYQGQELWDYSLVDPDNRRPVDYALRSRLLDGLLAGPPSAAELLRNWPDGRIKLWLTHRGLCLRRERPALFGEGSYRGIPAEGARRANVVALARERDHERVVAAAPRLVTRLVADPAEPPVGESIWGDTRLGVPAGRYEDVLTGRQVRIGGDGLAVADLFRELPLALLASI